MSIRILGGELKGLPLFVPENLKTRPTSVMLKRRLFDSFQDLSEVHFIDICAGTGSIGFEAISRGAQTVTFVECLPCAYKVLVKNRQLIEQKKRVQGKIFLEKKKVEKWLPIMHKTSLKWDAKRQENTILFFDPPYDDHELYNTVMNSIFKSESFNGMLWVEADTKKGPSDTFWQQYRTRLQKSFQQGTRIIYIFA